MKIFQIIKDTSLMKRTIRHKDLLPVIEKMDTTKKEVMNIVSEFSTIKDDIADDEIVELSLLPNLEDAVVRGLDDDLKLLVERLRGQQSDLDIVTISGMGGIGKTTLARKTHDHLSIRMTDRLDNRLIDLSSLIKLEELTCYSGAESRNFHWQPLSTKRFVFPTSLKRLTFWGFKFCGEDISTLAKLPNLEELTLIKNAAWGEVGRLSDEDKFKSLKLLLFSNIYIEHWEACSDSFPSLKSLVLKNCKCLRGIPTDFGEIYTLESIELHECRKAAEDSARKIEQEQENMGDNFLKVYIHNSRSYWNIF